VTVVQTVFWAGLLVAVALLNLGAALVLRDWPLAISYVLIVWLAVEKVRCRVSHGR
jgi:hypothetical protein